VDQVAGLQWPLAAATALPWHPRGACIYLAPGSWELLCSAAAGNVIYHAYSSRQSRVLKAAACLAVGMPRVRHHLPSKHAHPLSLKDSEQIERSRCPLWSTHLENHFSSR